MRVCPRCTTETEQELCPIDGAQTIAVLPGQETYHVGTLIGGRYHVDGVIGIGGFGAVYRCSQLAMNQTVAVKVLRNEHLTSVEHVKRFTREAQAVSKLKHPNTIHIFDFGSHSDGALYLAMEYLEGETLANRLDKNPRIYWETMVQIATQICHSLTEAHAMGLIHRDLKPENIMLMPVAGDPNFVKVLDFGIAKLQKDPAKPSEVSLTEAGMIMGTPTYMSPEQAKGDPIDGRSDVYALGVMLYEALTGQPPFHDDSAMKVLVAHIKDAVPPFPRKGHADEAPVEIEKVVLACLEKDPARRPQSTTQLVDRLMSAARRARDPQARANAAQEASTASMPIVEPPLPATGAMPAVDRPRLPATPDRQVPAVAGKPPSSTRTPLLVAGGALAAVSAGAALVLLITGNQTPAPQVPVTTGQSATPISQRLPPTQPTASAQATGPAQATAAPTDNVGAPKPPGIAAPLAAEVVAPTAKTPEPIDAGVATAKGPAGKPDARLDGKKLAGARPAEVKSAEGKTTETKPAETKLAATKPAETKPAETKPVETKPVETKPVEPKPVEPKPPTSNPNWRIEEDQ